MLALLLRSYVSFVFRSTRLKSVVGRILYRYICSHALYLPVVLTSKDVTVAFR